MSESTGTNASLAQHAIGQLELVEYPHPALRRMSKPLARIDDEGRPDAGEELVFINPQISKPRGTAIQQEGCLSLPGVRMDVRRPQRVRIKAYNLTGELIEADLDGFLARVVQHEFDHIEGRLFTDRLSEASALEASRMLSGFQQIFLGKQSRGELPDDHHIVARLDALEQARCQV
jgi:peptide deformylase